MKNLTLQDALTAVTRIKTGESLPIVTIGNTEYFPRKVVKYLRGLSNAIENTDLVLAKNAKEIGVRNIDKDQLDFPFMPTGMRMNFQDAADGLTPKTAAYASDAKPYWRNGEIKVVQDIVLSELPVSVLANNYAATSNADDFTPVTPFLIRPNKSFAIQTSLAGVAGADAFSLEIEGIEFVRNSRN